LTVTLIDQDLNKNTGSDEDLVIVNTTNTHLIPSLQIGSPLTIVQDAANGFSTVTSYSKIGYYTNASITATTGATAPYIFETGFT